MSIHFFKTKCVEKQVIMSQSNQFTHIYVKICFKILFNSFKCKKKREEKYRIFLFTHSEYFCCICKNLNFFQPLHRKDTVAYIKMRNNKNNTITVFLVFVLCWFFSLKCARTKQHRELCVLSFSLLVLINEYVFSYCFISCQNKNQKF